MFCVPFPNITIDVNKTMHINNHYVVTKQISALIKNNEAYYPTTLI